MTRRLHERLFRRKFDVQLGKVQLKKAHDQASLEIRILNETKDFLNHGKKVASSDYRKQVVDIFPYFFG